MLPRQKILTKLTILICILAVVNLGAMKFYWYQSIWWFDMPMHFFGGLVVVLILSYLFYSEITKHQKVYLPTRHIKIISSLIIGVLVVGAGWEVFEYIFNNLIGGQIFNILDTVSDLFFDVAGATAGIFIFML